MSESEALQLIIADKSLPENLSRLPTQCSLSLLIKQLKEYQQSDSPLSLLTNLLSWIWMLKSVASSIILEMRKEVNDRKFLQKLPKAQKVGD